METVISCHYVGKLDLDEYYCAPEKCRGQSLWEGWREEMMYCNLKKIIS